MEKNKVNIFLTPQSLLRFCLPYPNKIHHHQKTFFPQKYETLSFAKKQTNQEIGQLRLLELEAKAS